MVFMSSFILILSDSHRRCLIWVKFVEIPKQKFESQLNVIYCSLFSDKVRCFNQSERALYGNVIINIHIFGFLSCDATSVAISNASS